MYVELAVHQTMNKMNHRVIFDTTLSQHFNISIDTRIISGYLKRTLKWVTMSL